MNWSRLDDVVAAAVVLDKVVSCEVVIDDKVTATVVLDEVIGTGVVLYVMVFNSSHAQRGWELCSRARRRGSSSSHAREVVGAGVVLED